MKNTSLQILLPTYNGSRFLNQQLDSLVGQSYRTFTLLTRDDGSKDDSLSIVDSYRGKLPIERIPNPENTNIGALKSFEFLISHATADIIMFCDQDDIWEPDKVELGMAAMQDALEKHGDVPIAVFSDAHVFSESKPDAHSFLDTSGFNPHAIRDPYYLAFRNFAPGCTMTVNRTLLMRALPFTDDTHMHDWWLLLFASLTGKIVVIDKQPLRYRVHESNTLGIAEDKPLHPALSFLSMLNPAKFSAVIRRIIPGASQAKAIFRACGSRFSIPLFIVKLLIGRYFAPGIGRVFTPALHFSWKRLK